MGTDIFLVYGCLSGLAYSLHGVFFNLLIDSSERPAVDDACGHEKAVEWIAVEMWQSAKHKYGVILQILISEAGLANDFRDAFAGLSGER